MDLRHRSYDVNKFLLESRLELTSSRAHGCGRELSHPMDSAQPSRPPLGVGGQQSPARESSAIFGGIRSLGTKCGRRVVRVSNALI